MSRPAFTLIEMMVAMALALGIMLILTESFKMALDFVRSANSTGEMISQLNGAGILMSRDLRAEHFLPDDTKPNRGVKLSDQRLDWNGATGKTWTPPTGGFFRIVDPNPGVETTDAQGFTINAPATGHQLHFTAVLTGGTDANQFSALSGGATYTSRAAEVAYFLAPMGRSTSVGAGGQQLFNLIRRQRLLAVTTADQPSLSSAAADTEVISAVGPNVNTMTSVMNPSNRMGLAALPGPTPGPASPRYGEDIVVSNVLTFEVQADWTPGPTSPTAPRAFSTNTDAPYDFIPGGVFDTNGTPPPQSVQIKSLQILIRIYDPRMKQARQNTWKFAM
jgi:prepilin-type N-terminal cleavage/methylation domain-containing protein